jgi:hypothetical protein
MPLLELDAHSAWSNIFHPRGTSRFPRAGSDRLYPFALPETEPSFSISPKSKIFTMGSCFARNIEKHLARHDLHIPTIDYFGASEIINKYNPYSMLQEVRQALGLDPVLTPEQRLLKVGDNGWMDLHMHHSVPFDKSDCLHWIAKSGKFFQEVKKSPYFIITLGLVEVWYDNEFGVYINEPMNFLKYYKDDEEMRRRFMDRFTFRVLSYDEVYSVIYNMFSLFSDVSSGCKALLTVSPVALAGTFTGQDVLVANTYSKSVLRAAAEAICRKFDFIDYFPSYESVMLSPRGTTWDDDGVHVRDEVVALNVGRMVERYVKT